LNQRYALDAPCAGRARDRDAQAFRDHSNYARNRSARQRL